MLLLLDLRPLRCMAWGNRVVLPHAIQRNGRDCTNRNRPRHSKERRGLFLLNEKGRHNAGPVPEVVRLVGDLRYGNLTA